MAAVLLDRYLLQCLELALEAPEFCSCLPIAFHKEGRRPEDDDSRGSRHRIAGLLSILDARQFCGAPRDALGFGSDLLTGQVLVLQW